MRRLILYAFVVALSFALLGCGTATPTRSAQPAATQAPIVITVIVTATPVPITATAEATSATTQTAVATQPAGNNPTRAAGQATSTTRPVGPTNTRRPATATIAPQGTAVPSATIFVQKYPAVRLIGPVFIVDAGGRKDERHFPSDALTFEWESVGGLGGGECYMITVALKPGAGDSFLNNCESQIGKAQTVRFTLNQPSRAGPNYGSLLPNPSGDTTVSWFITIVRDDGLAADGAHHKFTPLSPPSDLFSFPFKG
ncbi:MAG: hypothetical protein HY327_10050 [Chloroflexi bacterium]|nr:hypothetical protein [Chloroflexota bacterium]